MVFLASDDTRWVPPNGIGHLGLGLLGVALAWPVSGIPIYYWRWRLRQIIEADDIADVLLALATQGKKLDLDDADLIGAALHQGVHTMTATEYGPSKQCCGASAAPSDYRR